jgi:N-acetylneuraminate synthase/N,N'-diacetyllegionaminate synthase
MIEKHFTLDKNLPGPDHHFSADPAEFALLVQSVRSLEESLGSAELKPASSEELGRRDYRLSCVAARELRAGHRLTSSDIAFRRPGSGIPPKELDTLIARELVQDVPPGHVFGPEDFA